jgi:hypothetical protein
MESYKYIYEARADFPEVNKTETLEKCHYQNAATYHKEKRPLAELLIFTRPNITRTKRI